VYFDLQYVEALGNFFSPTGGGLGGKKESGQLRFGGRERPFRRPM